MSLHHWQYFITVESDLAATTPYVEPTQANMACYSVEFASLLLAAGSEVDVLCKELCNKYSLTPSPADIRGYRNELTRRFPLLTDFEVRVPRYGLHYKPWEEWRTTPAPGSPAWWRSYNNVKHNRTTCFQESNLENTLKAMAGWFALVCYLNKSELWSRKADPWPKLLDLDPSWSHIRSTDLRPGWELPDFQGTY